MAHFRNGQTDLGKLDEPFPRTCRAHRPGLAFNLFESRLCSGADAMGSLQPDRAVRLNLVATSLPAAGSRDWPVVARHETSGSRHAARSSRPHYRVRRTNRTWDNRQCQPSSLNQRKKLTGSYLPTFALRRCERVLSMSGASIRFVRGSASSQISLRR